MAGAVPVRRRHAFHPGRVPASGARAGVRGGGRVAAPGLAPRQAAGADQRAAGGAARALSDRGGSWQGGGVERRTDPDASSCSRSGSPCAWWGRPPRTTSASRGQPSRSRRTAAMCSRSSSGPRRPSRSRRASLPSAAPPSRRPVPRARMRHAFAMSFAARVNRSRPATSCSCRGSGRAP